jgi:outer membrane protein assembly factor BamB
MFTTVFGYDKFSFDFAGIKFLGCASGPYVRMSDGHVPRDAVDWLDKQLKAMPAGQPVIFLNHYPLNDQLDNWYEVTDRLHNYNTWAILCGHGHTNKAFSFEDIPGVMGRSNLRARAATGGYNLVDVRNDSMIFSERIPGETLKPWTRVAITTHHYNTEKKYARPDYSLNDKYAVKEIWSYSSAANIISTPAANEKNIIVGNQQGEIVCLSRSDGKKKWSFQSGAPVFSSPAFFRDQVIFGTADGNIFCLNSIDGSIKWKSATASPVLGCPLIEDKKIFIGGSKEFFCIDAESGRLIWKFPLEGAVVSTPVIYKNDLIFGAWDTYLYVLDKESGHLKWKWNNGSTVRNYSPAACIPVVADGTVFIVAPDRYITALDEETGKTLWRNNDATVRESIGISADGKWIYGKTMQDTIVAYAVSREKQNAAWKMYCGFGYEHVPSMLIEKEGKLFFGTRSGVVYCIDPSAQKIIWAHKIDNSMVNTVRVLDGRTVVATTMDGKMVLLVGI